MSRSKKVFLALAVAFFLFLLWLMYDISRRTSFPGSKKTENDTPPACTGKPLVA